MRARDHRPVRLTARTRGASTRPCTRSPAAAASTTSASRRSTSRRASTRSSPRCTSTGTGSTSTRSPRELDRTPLGAGVSLGMHESQSRMWENLVGRSRPFWRFFYRGSRSGSPSCWATSTWSTWFRAVNIVQPSLIRIPPTRSPTTCTSSSASSSSRRCSRATSSRATCRASGTGEMDEYLGIEVPSDAEGVLQDMHW